MKFFLTFCWFMFSFQTNLYCDKAPFQLTSPTFKEQGSLPLKNSCKGENLSPALDWSKPPEGTKSLAIVCQDPDAPGGNFIHWIIYNIPADLSSLKEGIEKKELLSDGSQQGTNSFGRIGYDGPCPPKGKAHHYIFTLYALDSKLELGSDNRLQAFERAIEGHQIEKTQLTGLFHQ